MSKNSNVRFSLFLILLVLKSNLYNETLSVKNNALSFTYKYLILNPYFCLVYTSSILKLDNNNINKVKLLWNMPKDIE